jgi:O-methyltransferase involved in polyketide biosynthesis
MKTEPVHLTKEKETLLPALYGKALDSRAEDPILGDRFADEAVRRLDYDFAKLKLPQGAAVTLPMRAKHLDTWTREFLAKSPSATVLHLGCGLDSRVYRIDPPATVRWYDVDHPEVIELRRRVYPARPGYDLIGTSLTSPGWLDAIPADGPVLVVAEAVFVYVPEREGIALLGRITEKFPRGQFLFDGYSRPMVWMLRRMYALQKTGAILSWSIDDPEALARQVPRLELDTAIPFLTMPELIVRLRRSWLQRTIFGLLDHSTFVQNLVRHLRYRF